MISLASVKGPSTTVTCPLESRTRLPVSVGLSPPLPSMVPTLTASSLSLPMASINSFGGKPYPSLCLTIIMNFIVTSPFLFELGSRFPVIAPAGETLVLFLALWKRRTTDSKIDRFHKLFSAGATRSGGLFHLRLLLGYLGAQALFPLPQLGSKLGTEVLCFEDLANLNLRFPFLRTGAALDPFDRFFHGPHLPQPETGDQLLGLGERPVDHGPVLS